MGMCTILRLAPVLFTTWSQFACPDRHKEHIDVSAAPVSVALGALGICQNTTCHCDSRPYVQFQQGHAHVMAWQSSAICEMPTILQPFVGFIWHPGFGLVTVFCQICCSKETFAVPATRAHALTHPAGQHRCYFGVALKLRGLAFAQPPLASNLKHACPEELSHTCAYVFICGVCCFSST